MAKKNGNGRGNGKDPVVTAIHELTSKVVERLAALEVGQKGIEQILRGHGRQLEALHAGQAETTARLGRLVGRFHNLLHRARARDRRLEERVAKLEAREPETR